MDATSMEKLIAVTIIGLPVINKKLLFAAKSKVGADYNNSFQPFSKS